jgi:hypothetical protein
MRYVRLTASQQCAIKTEFKSFAGDLVRFVDVVVSLLDSKPRMLEFDLLGIGFTR